MKIPIPRRLDMRTRGLKGLTVKHTIILAAAVTLSVLLGMAGAGPLWTRILLASLTLLVALPFIFYQPGGKDFDSWLGDQFLFYIAPKVRLWQRGMEETAARQAEGKPSFIGAERAPALIVALAALLNSIALLALWQQLVSVEVAFAALLTTSGLGLAAALFVECAYDWCKLPSGNDGMEIDAGQMQPLRPLTAIIGREDDHPLGIYFGEDTEHVLIVARQKLARAVTSCMVRSLAAHHDLSQLAIFFVQLNGDTFIPFRSLPLCINILDESHTALVRLNREIRGRTSVDMKEPAIVVFMDDLRGLNRQDRMLLTFCLQKGGANNVHIVAAVEDIGHLSEQVLAAFPLHLVGKGNGSSREIPPEAALLAAGEFLAVQRGEIRSRFEVATWR